MAKQIVSKFPHGVFSGVFSTTSASSKELQITVKLSTVIRIWLRLGTTMAELEKDGSYQESLE